MAISTVYRLARIGSDHLIFSPKFTLGIIEAQYTLSDNTQSATDINRLGMLIADATDIFEFEVSGTQTKLGGSDEVMFFNINYIKPL